ncbi:hypothetical protein [Clostridium sp. UBA2485]|uniref:hypothetical protein n=1 Tax=Clostridium sp. UBA2485 TaxID=1946352 RepID=UPI0025C53BFD|nr:hypothetical protein [Clostridium sp. UBA2485]
MKKVKIFYRSGQIVSKNFKEFDFVQNKYFDYEGNTKIRLDINYTPLDGEKVHINPSGIDFIEVKGV